MTIPENPKIYHIVHVDRLPSIVADEGLWCDAEIVKRHPPGTSIGMNKIKHRRLKELRLASHPNLYVGDCVPFYFWPRSIMLYLIYQANHPELTYKGGQEPILHLQADLYTSVSWATQHKRKWAFTLSNAGSRYFEDRCDLEKLNEINWAAVKAQHWQAHKEAKQAEFLMEYHFPWHLIEHIGVKSASIYQQVVQVLQVTGHKPQTKIQPEWYY